MPRVLIVAPSASARFGGEAFLPLHYFRVLRSQGVDCWLLTHERVSKELIDLFPDDTDRMFFVSDSKWQIRLWYLGRKFPEGLQALTTMWLIRLLSQRRQRAMARELIREHDIQIVHEPIPVSPKFASGMHSLGVPVIFGPMNGGMGYPAAFAHMASRSARILIPVLRSLASFVNRLIPGKRRAALLMVANQRSRDALPASVLHVPILELVENGVDLNRFERDPEIEAPQDRVRFAFVGRILPLKMVDALIHAVARIDIPTPVTLEIFGDGDIKPDLERLVESLGVSDKVTFHGFVAQSEIAKRLQECHALALPSVHECGGAVVMEAMALSLPVVAANWGGPADYVVNDSTGFLVEPAPFEEFVDSLAEALTRLAADPELRRSMGIAGRARVEAEFDWDAKIRRILEIYRGVLDEKTADLSELVGL